KSAHLERLVQPPVIQSAPPKKKGIPPAYARIDRNVYLLVIIVAALVGIAWWAVQHKRAESEIRAETAPTIAVPKRKVIAQPTPAPPPALPKTNETLHLIVELTDDSYIDLEADGKTIMKDTYRRGTRDSFEAKESFRLRRVGNAAGVILTLNDKQLPPLGRDGEVIKNRVLDRSYLAKLNP